MFGGVPDSYGYQETTAPKQVTVAAVISAGLGAMCLLLAGLTLTSAGGQISEVLTGSRGNTPVAIAAALVCAVLYLVPAIYVRKRHTWARYLLIVVAAMGIAGGLMALPTSLLGLAIHATLLILMLQRPTKLWLRRR
jgi:drug/metabolite transporter (DMT)-like permease